MVRYTGGAIPVGGSVTFTFRTTLAAGVTAGLAPNTASAQATTLPGVDSNERTEPAVYGSASVAVGVARSGHRQGR